MSTRRPHMNTSNTHRISHRISRFLATYSEIGLATALVLGSIASVRLLPVAAFVLTVLQGRRWWLQRDTAPRDGWLLHLPVLLLLLAGVSLVITVEPAVTLEQVLRLLCGIGWYWTILAGVQNWHQVALGCALLAAIGLGFALLTPPGIAEVADRAPALVLAPYTYLGLLRFDTIHANVMAGYFVLLLPCALALWLLWWHNIWPWFLGVYGGVAAGMMLGMLVLTQSRGALLALGAGLVCLVTLHAGWKWGLGMMGVSVAGGVIVGPTFQVPTAAETLAGRWDIWTHSWQALHDFLFTGVGLGTLGITLDTLYPLRLFAPGEIPHAHNLYLQIAADLGIFGLLAWLAIFGLVSWHLGQVWWSSRQQNILVVRILSACLLSSQLAFATQGLVDAVTWGMVRPAPLVWGLWGLALALRFAPMKQQNETPYASIATPEPA